MLFRSGASAALCISPLPFRGPLGSVRLAQIGGRFVPFPTIDQLEESDLDLVVSGSPTAVLMIEGFAREMPEDRMLQALEEAHRIIRVICEMQEELVRKAGKPKKEYVLADYSALRDQLTRGYLAELKTAKAIGGKQDRGQAVKALRERAKAEVVPSEPAATARAGDAGGVSDADFAEIEKAFDESGVVVIRDQHLTPEQHIAFSARFGRLESYPVGQFSLPGHNEILVVSNILENGKPIGMVDAGRAWHSDMSFTPAPPRASPSANLHTRIERDASFNDAVCVVVISRSLTIPGGTT